MDNRIYDLGHTLVSYGIPVTLRTDGFSIGSGFYKSDGTAHINKVGNTIILTTRYGRTKEIETVADIVHESYYWYEVSKTRYGGWRYPASQWVKLYEHAGYGIEKTPEQELAEAKAELARLQALILEAPHYFAPQYDFDGKKALWLKNAGLAYQDE